VAIFPNTTTSNYTEMGLRQKALRRQGQRLKGPSGLLATYKGGLYDSLVANLPKQQENIKLWPYMLEIQSFGECKSSSCASPDEVVELYTASSKVFNAAMEMEQSKESAKDENRLRRVLDSCDTTPVAFIDVKNTDKEDPAWIVTSKDGDGWILDMVRSGDQKKQSERFTFEKIIKDVVPSYPHLLHAKNI
jgi:hypothetical protein